MQLILCCNAWVSVAHITEDSGFSLSTFCSVLSGSLLLEVQGCSRDLSQEKKYYMRYRVCMEHLKMNAIYVDGELARFCQQCGRFHELSKFDGLKR